MTDTLGLTSFILSLAIYLFLMFKIVNAYRIHRFTPLIYLFLVIILLTLLQFIIFLPEPEEHEISQQLIQMSGVLLFMSFALLLTLLFFESFDKESVLSTRNVILMLFVTTLGFVIMTSMLFITSLFVEDPERFAGSDELELSTTESLMFVILVSSVLLDVIIAITMGVMIFKTLRRKIKETNNPQVKNLVKKIVLGSIIMTIGGEIARILNIFRIGNLGVGDILEPFVSIFGLYMMIHYFLKGGIFLFQGDSLRRLIIITDSGLPIYSYSFRRFNIEEDIRSDSLSERGGQEVLFSGAIKSISYLLSEFTGSNEVIREIFLDDTVMMVKMLPNNSSVILLSNKSTKFFRNAIDKFSSLVSSLAEEIPDGQAFNTYQVKVANELLESSFGFGYYQQIGSE